MARLCVLRTIFIFWIYSRLFRQVQAQWCYYPGGDDKALQDYPCDPYAYTTLCCPLGWTCFSNNLCVVTDETAVGSAYPVGTALRGTCTNPSWNDTVCGNFCLDDTGASNNGSLQSCGGGSWCCQSSVNAGTCDCTSGQGTFSIPDGEAQTIIGIQGLGSTSINSQAASTPSSALQITSSTPLSTTSKVSRTSSSPKSTPTSSTLLTSSALSSHTSPTPTSHTSSPTGSLAAATSTHPALSVTQKPGFKAGIAVAVIFVAFVIAGFCLWFFWYRHRDRHPNIPAMSDAGSDIYSPEPTSALPGLILRPNPDPYEYRGGNDGLRLSPVSDRGNGRNSGWSGGHSGGFPGRATAERIRPVVDPYRIPYEGT